MASVELRTISGGTAGTVELPEAWFAAPLNIHLMHEVVTAQQAAARQGTAKAKSRGEVRGGGAKPWRQKGTGRARHGSIRSPMWKGGGVSHGPSPRSYTKRVNKKARRGALASALSDRARDGNVTVVDDLAFEVPRTRDAVAALEALGHGDQHVLVVLDDVHEATMKSFRNLPDVHLNTVDQLNVHDVLRSDVVVIAEGALSLIGTGRRSGATGSDGEDAT